MIKLNWNREERTATIEATVETDEQVEKYGLTDAVIYHHILHQFIEAIRSCAEVCLSGKSGKEIDDELVEKKAELEERAAKEKSAIAAIDFEK